MAIRLVVFDLDGTLIDSRRDLADSVNALLVELGAAPLGLEAVTAMVGEGAATLVRRALVASQLPADTPHALDRFLAQYDQRLTTHTQPYAGIPKALEELASADLGLAVLTNKPQRATATILERLGLSRWFFQVIGGDTSARRKPDPAGLLSLAKAATATPAETMLVGDSVIDLKTAHHAGSAICLARYGFGLHLDGITLRGDEAFIDHPGELRELTRHFGEPGASARTTRAVPRPTP